MCPARKVHVTLRVRSFPRRKLFVKEPVSEKLFQVLKGKVKFVPITLMVSLEETSKD